MDVEDIEDFQATDASTGARIIHSLPPVVGRSSRPSSTAAGSCAQQQCSSTHEPSSVPGTQRVWLKTFGCSHNASDSEYMAGLLQAYGYQLVEEAASGQAHLWLINSCTVKNPSQAAMGTLVARAQQLGKSVLVAGCVPQGDRRAKELEGVSLLGGWRSCTPRTSLPAVVLLLCAGWWPLLRRRWMRVYSQQYGWSWLLAAPGLQLKAAVHMGCSARLYAHMPPP